MVKERGCPVRFTEIIDRIRRLVELCHKLWWQGFRLLSFRCDIDEGPFGFKRLKDCFGLAPNQFLQNATGSNKNVQKSKVRRYLFRNQVSNVLSIVHKFLYIALNQGVEILNLWRNWIGGWSWRRSGGRLWRFWRYDLRRSWGIIIGMVDRIGSFEGGCHVLQTGCRGLKPIRTLVMRHIQ